MALWGEYLLYKVFLRVPFRYSGLSEDSLSLQDSRAILRVRTSKTFQCLDVTVQKPVGRMDPPHKGVGPQKPVTHEKVALSRDDVALG